MIPGPADRSLARRLHRDARAAAKAQLRAELWHARAVERRERRRARARRKLPGQAVVGAGLALASIPLDGVGGGLVGGAGFFALLFAARSASILYVPDPPPLRLPPGASLPAPLPPPPAVSSVAFPYVRRLEVVRDELRRLVPLVSEAGRDAAEEAWAAASEADTALRWQAARLAAVEPHRGAEPELVRALEDGVSCQEKLVRGVADLVAASADPLAGGRLRDVTDRLHGIAQGLREVR